MEKIRINFFDTNIGDGFYANCHWPVPEIEYIKPPLLEWEGITVFTDELCFHPIVDEVKSKYKIAWAFESPVIKPYVYTHIKEIEDKFDYIYICKPELHRNAKYKQCYFGACWVPEQLCKIYDKTKMLSIIASNKNYAQGHKLRHEVISKNPHPELELWGSGYNWFSDEPEGRVSPFRDYRYVIVIENCQYPGYLTDKIVDCFATGCIPIYWGCPDIGDHFNTEGFYVWNTYEELQEILDKISAEDYDSKRAYVEENYSRFRELASPDRWMLDNCYRKLLEK